jgi:uncharacterized membrane protein YozB (DUF420 family)
MTQGLSAAAALESQRDHDHQVVSSQISWKRLFYVAMASFIILTAFIGFAPSFYLRSIYNPGHSLSTILRVHGLFFSAWMILFLVQTVLIVRGSRILHRRLGWAAAGIAAVMVALGIAASIEQMRRVPLTIAPQVGLALNTFPILVFVILVGSAIYYRGRSDWHKRLILSATISLLGAAMLRIIVPHAGSLKPPEIFILASIILDLFFVPSFIYDWRTRHKIHPAYFCALTLLIVSQISIVTVIQWPPWIRLAHALQRYV